MENYINENKDSYEKKYNDGWGNRYPDSNMISIYYNIIREHITADKPKLLDFGCSLGANTKFFENIGFDVYGLDISSIAIKRCVEINEFNSNHFIAADIVNGTKPLEEIFDVEFDLIVASECLYYFSDTDINNVLIQFKKSLRNGGILYASMASYNHPSYRTLINVPTVDGLTFVPDTGSMDEPVHINLVKNIKELERKFSIINKLKTCRSTLTLDSESEILYYIGRNE